jgi:hypothetical protein
MLAAPPTDKDPILEDVPLKLTFAVVRFAVPLDIVVFVSVTLPRLVTVEPNATVVLPITALLLERLPEGKLPLVIVTLVKVRFPRLVVVLLAATLVLPRVIGKPEDPPLLLTVFNMITSHHLELYICLPNL